MDAQDAWVMFAAAWLARGGEALKYGASEGEHYANVAQTAAIIADRMLQLQAQRSGAPPPAPPPQQQPPAPRGSPMAMFSQRTRGAVESVMRQSGLSSSLGGVMPPAIAAALPALTAAPDEGGQELPSASPGAPCLRAIGTSPRGVGQDCQGQYDAQLLCTTCRLPAPTPAEAAQNARIAQARASGRIPGVPPQPGGMQ